ncbi:hypothetical protein Tco_0985260 [Tanacetum coccineum]
MVPSWRRHPTAVSSLAIGLGGEHRLEARHFLLTLSDPADGLPSETMSLTLRDENFTATELPRQRYIFLLRRMTALWTERWATGSGVFEFSVGASEH